MDVLFCILAGGKSSRFGLDKRFVYLRGKKIIDYSIDLVKSFSEEVFISAKFNDNLEEIENATIVKDSVAFGGPLCGIYQIMTLKKSDYYIFLGADMPFINTKMIQKMIDRFNNSNHIYMFRCKRTVYPLPLSVSYGVLNFLKQSNCKNKRIKELFNYGKPFFIDWSNCNNFFNINTQEDLLAAEKLNLV